MKRGQGEQHEREAFAQRHACTDAPLMTSSFWRCQKHAAARRLLCLLSGDTRRLRRRHKEQAAAAAAAAITGRVSGCSCFYSPETEDGGWRRLKSLLTASGKFSVHLNSHPSPPSAEQPISSQRLCWLSSCRPRFTSTGTS